VSATLPLSDGAVNGHGRQPAVGWIGMRYALDHA